MAATPRVHAYVAGDSLSYNPRQRQEIFGSFRTRHRRNADTRTWHDSRGDLTQFAAVVGDYGPAKVTSGKEHRFSEIDLFSTCQREKGCKPATANRRLAAILAFYTFLGNEDPVLVCPIFPRRHYLREQRLPRPGQEEALWAFFKAIEAETTLH